MKLQASVEYDCSDDPLFDVEEIDQVSQDDLWFLPGPMEEKPDDLPPRPGGSRVRPRFLMSGGKQRRAMLRALLVSLAVAARWTTG